MSENSTESIIREEEIPSPYLPERKSPQPSSGSFWGKVALAAVAGLAGVVVGAMLSESANDVDSDCCDDDDDVADEDDDTSEFE